MLRLRLALLLAFACAFTLLHAQTTASFDDHFIDATLRIDYLLTGDASGQAIVVNRLYRLPTWAGRRHHLTELPLAGNGEVVMRDQATGEVIYRTSFSSLFLEWLETDEASTTPRGFEHVVLLPYPKHKAEIEISLLNPQHEVTTTLKHTADPEDILIGHIGEKGITPHRYLLKSGASADCIDVAILAEGYTEEEMETFYADASIACESLFAHEPFQTLRASFNIVAVASPSIDSGVSVPRLGDWKQTAFGSHFSTFYSDRYLTTNQVSKMHDALAGIDYEHIIVLANTDEYGGGGIYNAYTLTTAHHAMFRPVVVHEFGHSFGGLGDEYFYDDDLATSSYPPGTEPWEPNITTLSDFASKWQELLAPGTPVPTPVELKDQYPVGVYEGGGYVSHGVYRPAFDCRMRTNTCPAFCPACQRALTQLIEFYTKE